MSNKVKLVGYTKQHYLSFTTIYIWRLNPLDMKLIIVARWPRICFNVFTLFHLEILLFHFSYLLIWFCTCLMCLSVQRPLFSKGPLLYLLMAYIDFLKLHVDTFWFSGMKRIVQLYLLTSLLLSVFVSISE